MYNAAMLDNYLTIGNPQIEIRFIDGEAQYAWQAFEALDEAIPSILEYFRVTESFPKMQVVLVNHRDEFDRLVRDLLKVEIEVPSHPARIAQPQRTDMVVISPSAYATHSIFTYVPEDFRRLLVHEFVHIVEEFVTPDIEASPRWWGEGLAVYFSGQWLFEDEFRKAALDGVAERKIPSFKEIETERKLAYDWGWTIVRFIENTYGRDRIVQIVRECADGDVLHMIGEDLEELESRWKEWLLGDGNLAPFRDIARYFQVVDKR
jgi:hypothetical protein